MNNQEMDLNNLQEEIMQLKKQLVILRMKRKTNQKIEAHIIKKTQHKICQLLTLHYS
uniref:Ribosomal protein L29 n=1 Tax=Kuetzingia canaliculata TaxID=228262 RepID=A0A1Z1MPA2_KUECA|nr:ribosomal protein L29 [Kuetzingia canaliculata]ARW67920.1 ribosomal protein L29 [Kuetzingia canaliculata]